jgi:hypothetical protein
MRPPTSLVGVMDEGRYYALSVDFAETVPDVVWPTSNITYATMRNDPAISAVLSAYMLPIRRATWTVDPAGCRDEVVRMVADDLGIPVLGDDQPGAARVRGVSWGEHLRAALMYLVYGHAAFEMLADVSTGQARLVGLYERTQHTIAAIHSTDNGDFDGITQFYSPDRGSAPEIPAERMVFYSHLREGSAWAGRSLLRASFAPWLLKREMQRVLATSSRRFGMGVPVMEALPGAIVTPEQMAHAQQLASAARVGETGGAATPPNFTLKLKGLEGSVPDTLAFIQWLDQQISRSTLAQFLDLGQTETGSRALGSAFIDLFLLSLAAIAEDVADQATRQAAARIVTWNFGDTEPVPAVRVTDVGTRHDVTADALSQLMQAGAIGPDPALEAFMRRAYQLPERTTPWVSPTAPAPPGGNGPQPGAQSVAAAARPRRLRKKPPEGGQLTLPIAAAADSPTAAAARVGSGGVDVAAGWT